MMVGRSRLSLAGLDGVVLVGDRGGCKSLERSSRKPFGNRRLHVRKLKIGGRKS